MKEVNVWDAMGKLLNTFDTDAEADEWIKECGHYVIGITYPDGDTNIIVIPSA